MKLTEIVRERGLAVTAEVAPPKGSDPAAALGEARKLAALVDAINVTDGQGAAMRMSPIALARLMVEEGIVPVWQATCRDRNRIALQADLLAADALGVENALIVTGDHMVLGDHPDAKPVFDLDSVQLLHVAAEMLEGHDLAGNALDTPLDLCLGAVVAPEADNVELQLIKLRKKIDSGAEFIQTQAIFDPAAFARFMERADLQGVPVLAGIIPVTSPQAARFMNARIPGVNVPTWVIQLLNEAEVSDRPKVAAQIAGQIGASALEHCQGLHIMAQGRSRMLPDILSFAGVARA
ncbi:MAG: 5,10-methylenetetrahydrofolate reductase [candidate division WS1 bacterium]|jgi:5,10-methylenetetrahydrofolate reductase|nr:5,10-methylenetetrahydrofolate reductase [candidate division WS1 bacterium]